MDAPRSRESGGTLARRTLVRIAIRVGLVIAVVTLLAYQHMVSNLEEQALAQLESYVRERGRHERELLARAERTQARVRRELIARLAETDPAAFDARFTRHDDGVVRNRPEALDGARHAQVWAGRDAELDASLRRRLVAAHAVVERLGPGVEAPFINLYVSFPENALAYWWPTAPDWSTRVDPALDIRGEEYVRVATPEANPERRPVWTGVYRDRYGPWMVSCETPVDVDGRHVATVGQDLTLDALLERTRTERLPGTHNLLFRGDGRLIAHPRLYAEGDARDLQIGELDDAGLQETLRLARALPEGEHLAFNEVDEVWLGVSHVEGPDWFWVVVYPKSLVAERAAGTAWVILLLGLLSLLVEILIFYLVLRRDVAEPLEALTVATEAMARGERDAPLPVGRPDELGRLASAFERMRDAVTRKADELTEEARAREESERRLLAILEQTPAVVFIKDVDGRYTLVNQRFRELLGRPAAGLTDHDFLPPEVADAMRENDRQVIEGGVAIQFEERVPVDGIERVYVTVKFPITDSDGEPLGVCGIATDVTQRKELEEQLRHSQKMDALGQLAGGVAHDFNNLLTVILAQSDLLKRSLKDSPDLAADVDLVLDAGERARVLTRQLLAFSRRELYDAQVFDARTVLDELRALLRRLIPANISVQLDLGDTPLHVRADRGQIEQAILNLATNARDAMPDGGELRLAASKVTVEEDDERGAEPGEHVSLRVSDTGIGMDEVTRLKAMEPFFTTKEGSRGTGLGLAIVYGIVKQSGGVTHLRSLPGQGTTVEILLPAVREVPAGVTDSQLESYTEGSETVLVLEDSELVARVARRTLRSRGYEVLMATSGEEAIAIAEAHEGEIHALVSDVMLPGMDGPAAAARIRELRPGIAVLFITGHVDERTLEGTLGPDDEVLEKPFRPATLAYRLRRVLDGERGEGAQP
ncbi:MAG: PAS domain-containing protein [Myxococcota bacterium]|nr:PAS domain-containing protein [Myxococcota bacterium]